MNVHDCQRVKEVSKKPPNIIRFERGYDLDDILYIIIHLTAALPESDSSPNVVT